MFSVVLWFHAYMEQILIDHYKQIFANKITFTLAPKESIHVLALLDYTCSASETE